MTGILKIGKTFYSLNQIISIKQAGSNWEILTTSTTHPRVQEPIDSKEGHKIGALLERLWEATQLTGQSPVTVVIPEKAKK